MSLGIVEGPSPIAIAASAGPITLSAAPAPISVVGGAGGAVVIAQAATVGIAEATAPGTISNAPGLIGTVVAAGPQGIPGPTGAPGATGAPGSGAQAAFISGSGSPSSALGLVGQMYVDVSGGTTVMAPVWGPKTDTGWGSGPMFWVALSAVVIATGGTGGGTGGTGGTTYTPSADFSNALNSQYLALLFRPLG